VRKAELVAQVESLRQTLDDQVAEQRELIAELTRRVERQETRTHELQLRFQQRIAALEQVHQDDLSLMVEARKRQQQKLVQLQDAVETHKQQLETLDAALNYR
jgi:peptidoglycan hydrolase CwlO-like protein